MDMMYRPLLPHTQYCPCTVNPIGLSSLPNYNNPSPFFRALFAPYTPLWINPSPQRVDNSPSVAIDAPPQQAGIDFRLAFERKKKIEAKHLDSVVPFRSLYIPKGRWHWTHQVTFEDRSEHVRMRGACVYITRFLVLMITLDSQQYTQTIKTATIYQETITYISKLYGPSFSQLQTTNPLTKMVPRNQVGRICAGSKKLFLPFVKGSEIDLCSFVRLHFTKLNSEPFMVLQSRLLSVSTRMSTGFR